MKTGPALALALLAAACVASCSSAPPKAIVVRPPVARAARSSDLDALVEKRCEWCHEATAGTPRLVGRLDKDRDLAMRAALMISAYRMPPPPARLDRTERDHFVAELCARGADDGERCTEMLSPGRDFAHAIGTRTLLRAVDSVTGRAGQPTEPSSVELLLLMQGPGPPSMVTKADPTLVVGLMSLALDRCPSAEAGPDGPAKFEACARAILDRKLTEFPRPGAP